MCIRDSSNVLEENTKKIKELEYIDDEAANIFSVKVRKEEFYKQKEASSLKEQSNSIKALSYTHLTFFSFCNIL